MVPREIRCFDSNHKVITAFAIHSKTQTVCILKLLVSFDRKHKLWQIIQFLIRTKNSQRKANGLRKILFQIDCDYFFINEPWYAISIVQKSRTDSHQFLERELEIEVFFEGIFRTLQISLLMRVLLIGNDICDLSETELHVKTIRKQQFLNVKKGIYN